MWSLTFAEDPLDTSLPLGDQCSYNTDQDLARALSCCDSVIVKATIDIQKLFSSILNEVDVKEKLAVFEEGQRVARTTLAHLFSQALSENCPYVASHNSSTDDDTKDGRDKYYNESSHPCVIEPLSFMRRWKKVQLILSKHSVLDSSNGKIKRTKLDIKDISQKLSSSTSPYIMERTDVWCSETSLHITLAVIVHDKMNGNATYPADVIKRSTMDFLTYISNKVIGEDSFLSQIANVVLQNKVRALLPSINAVAFMANDSIMPRKSGVSCAPMSSPPAIPFIAPEGSKLKKEVKVSMGKLGKFITNTNVTSINDEKDEFTIAGMIVPKGITLIVGGGYHGKSTMLRAIMAGVYDKILGDGRELCVTDVAAVTVRAEDGRYVNNTNVSAFISNLPITGSDTKHFSTREASGSTSQASNVVDAIEMGASALLVDEDVSAANFMSRDGRMRALVMDESITPLLYRVNGLYNRHGISSVVVVGGVGDWLDVPNAVIRLEKYVASDALDKAKSISRQFSHGHVQYGGRGVVHRLEWDIEGTPCRRKPIYVDKLVDFKNVRISLLDSSGKFSIANNSHNEEDELDDIFAILGHEFLGNEDDIGTIDMTKCEQLLGRKYQLYGCAICVVWLLKTSVACPSLDLNQLLDRVESALDGPSSFNEVIESLSSENKVSQSLTSLLGYALRPRRYEILMALSRMRGITFEELPPDDDVLAEITRKQQEEEEKKKRLAELWANRRKK